MKLASFYITLLASLLLMSCLQKKRLIRSAQSSAPSEVVQSVSEIDTSLDYSLEIERLHKVDSSLIIDFTFRDENGKLYRLETDDQAICGLEYFKDGYWHKVEDFEVANTTKKSCEPHDYCIILDQSSSMSENQSTIFKETQDFIEYKNDGDRMALIKYGKHPVLACHYLTDKEALKAELFDKQDDTLNSSFTYTVRAYQLFNDSIKPKSTATKQSVILFSDFSGMTAEELGEPYLHNYIDSIKTHRVMYDDSTQWRWRVLWKKETIRRVYKNEFGQFFPVRDYASIGEALKRIVDENCFYSTVQVPLAELGVYKFRITTCVGSRYKETVVIGENTEEALSISQQGNNYIEPEDTLYRTGEPILLNVYFDTDSDSLLPKSFEEIDNVYNLMSSRPKMKIEIHGHTDNQGSAAHNKDLSQRRAVAVKNALTDKGIEPERIVAAKGFGYDKPIASNDSAEGRALNRRTEFVIVEQ